MEGIIGVTYRCNAKCQMCNTWQFPTKAATEIQTTKGLKEYTKIMNAIRLQLMEFCKDLKDPFAQKRKIKIVYVGLDRAGKTSFLLAVKKKYSIHLFFMPDWFSRWLSRWATFGSCVFAMQLIHVSSVRELCQRLACSRLQSRMWSPPSEVCWKFFTLGFTR